MAILGVDFGLKRIGVAFARGDSNVAFPGPVLTGTADELLEQVAREAASQKATEIVIGLPKNMDGSHGEMSVRVTAFARKLGELTSANIVMWDERLTSVQARRRMLSTGPSRKQRKKRIDALAAQLILQSYLDSKLRK